MQALASKAQRLQRLHKAFRFQSFQATVNNYKIIVISLKIMDAAEKNNKQALSLAAFIHRSHK